VKQINWCICTVFTVHPTSNRHIKSIVNFFKFIMLDCVAAQKSRILDWCTRDFCDWSISSLSIWNLMSSRQLTKYNTLRDNAHSTLINTHAHSTLINRLKPWCSGVPWALCSTRYAMPMCDIKIVSMISQMLRAVAAIVIIILYFCWWSQALLCCVCKLMTLSSRCKSRWIWKRDRAEKSRLWDVKIAYFIYKEKH